MVRQRLKSLALEFDARIDFERFEEFFFYRSSRPEARISAVVEDEFLDATGAKQKNIAKLIKAHRKKASENLEKEISDQELRLSKAKFGFAKEETKTLEKEIGIATRRIDKAKAKLDAINKNTSGKLDSRIFAFHWAPVIIMERGERRIVPMRYHLRPFGAPASFDGKYPGCYNARFDNLDGFWKGQFGSQHAVVVITSFFENVKQRAENVVLEFKPKNFSRMIVPCIWDQWNEPKT